MEAGFFSASFRRARNSNRGDAKVHVNPNPWIATASSLSLAALSILITPNLVDVEALVVDWVIIAFEAKAAMDRHVEVGATARADIGFRRHCWHRLCATESGLMTASLFALATSHFRREV